MRVTELPVYLVATLIGLFIGNTYQFLTEPHLLLHNLAFLLYSSVEREHHRTTADQISFGQWTLSIAVTPTW